MGQTSWLGSAVAAGVEYLCARLWLVPAAVPQLQHSCWIGLKLA